MPDRRADLKAWEAMWTEAASLESSIRRSKAKNVNTAKLREGTRRLVFLYFEKARPALVSLNPSAENRTKLDAEMRFLLGLSSGRNSKTSYLKCLRTLRDLRKVIETSLEFLIGPAIRVQPYSGVEELILSTLTKLAAKIADSYRQVLSDIRSAKRPSYRGTAAELREVVREVIDQLAPDDAVIAVAGYKNEIGRTAPTMKQKVKFILSARKKNEAIKQTATDALAYVEENVGAIGRAVYTRGSVDVHTARPLEEILNFKLYADALLGELLEIHRTDPGSRQ